MEELSSAILFENYNRDSYSPPELGKEFRRIEESGGGCGLLSFQRSR
jgi:hypothetical protein